MVQMKKKSSHIFIPDCVLTDYNKTITNRFSKILKVESIFDPIFSENGVWDVIAVDEILERVFKEKEELNRALLITNDMSIKYVTLSDYFMYENKPSHGLKKKEIRFPGLASDSRVFSALENEKEIEIQCVNYLSIDFDNGMDAIIDEMIRSYSINNGDVLTATSFGALLAFRIKKILPRCELNIYGGIVCKRELGWLGKMLLTYELYKWVSIRRIPSWLVERAFGLSSQNQRKIFIDMMHRFDDEKITSMLNIIRASKNINGDWDYRVHGKNDFLIPKPFGNIEWKKGGHVLTML
jgi:hypothetical protein